MSTPNESTQDQLPSKKSAASCETTKAASRNSDDHSTSSSESRKRKVLEHTLEELQNERERLREKNRTNSQRFRDRKKDFMDTLFEEKYSLGKENNELKAEKEKLTLLLQEALAEKKQHQLQQRKNALLVAKRTMPPPLYQDSLLLPPSPYDAVGTGLPFGYSGMGAVGLGMSKGLLPGLSSTGMLGLGASPLSSLIGGGLKDEASLLGASAMGLGLGAARAGLVTDLPPRIGGLGYLERNAGLPHREVPAVVLPENVNS